jgi:hypothetical protein
LVTFDFQESQAQRLCALGGFFGCSEPLAQPQVINREPDQAACEYGNEMIDQRVRVGQRAGQRASLQFCLRNQVERHIRDAGELAQEDVDRERPFFATSHGHSAEFIACAAISARSSGNCPMRECARAA